MRKINVFELDLHAKRKIKANALKATKNLLLQEQKGDFDKEELIDEIITGRNSLLTANDIAARLGISIEVFHQWVKNADPKYQPPTGVMGYACTENHSFAKPDVYIGSYPRWSIETFRDWLRTNLELKKAG